MIFIYTPILSTFFFYRYAMEYNTIISIFLSPIVYLIFTGILIWKQQFNNFHFVLNEIFPFSLIETGITTSLSYTKRKLLEIDRINRVYVWMKIRILLYIIKIIGFFIPNKYEKDLKSELQQDYLNILYKNKQNGFFHQ